MFAAYREALLFVGFVGDKINIFILPTVFRFGGKHPFLENFIRNLLVEFDNGGGKSVRKAIEDSRADSGDYEEVFGDTADAGTMGAGFDEIRQHFIAHTFTGELR